MEKDYQLLMDTVLKTKKGFSLLEMLVCMVIISAFMLVSLRNTNRLNLDHYYFLNDYLYKQSEAMITRQGVSIGSGIYFNSMGHVNQARTIDFLNHSIVIHLGNGYATIK